MFDCHTLENYSISPGDTIRVESWDGMSDFLNLAALGFTTHVMGKISNTDEALARFQMKVRQLGLNHEKGLKLVQQLSAVFVSESQLKV